MRIRDITEKNKTEIIEILMKYYEESKKERAKNIFLNEVEILEKSYTKIKT